MNEHLLLCQVFKEVLDYITQPKHVDFNFRDDGLHIDLDYYLKVQPKIQKLTYRKCIIYYAVFSGRIYKIIYDVDREDFQHEKSIIAGNIKHAIEFCSSARFIPNSLNINCVIGLIISIFGNNRFKNSEK